MKERKERITASNPVRRLAALALAVCAAGGAWAAITATEVWEAAEIKGKYDSTTGLIAGHNNSAYKLNVGTGLVVDDSTGAYTLGSDGSITINSAASHGVTIDLAGKVNGNNPTSLSILVKYRSLSACNMASLISAFMTRDGTKPECGLIQTANNALTLKPYWYIASNSSSYNFDISSPSVSASGGYALFSYDRSTIKGYTGSELNEGGTASMSWTGPSFKTAAIGGSSGEVTDNSFNNKWPGLVIEKIALFVGNTSDDIATYYFPSDDPTALDYDFVKTISSNTALSEIASWDTGTGTPGAEDTVHIVCENSAVLTIDTAINADTLWVEGGSVTLANGASITANMVFGSPITVAASATASISGASVYNSIAFGSYSTLNISNCAINGAITDGDKDSNTHATLNITDCAINGGITAGQNNYATINTAGTVVFRSSADNHFKYSSTLNVNSGTTTYNSSNSQKLWCNINVAKGATLVNSRDDSFDFGANANWPIHAYIRGTLTLNQKWTVAAGNYIHLYDDAVINGSASIHANVSGSQTKIVSEEGTSTITAPVVKGNGSVSVQTKDGTTLVLTSSTELVKSGAGTLRLKDVAWTGAVSGSEGTVEVYNTRNNAHSQVSASGITFSGKIKFTAKGTYGVYVTNKDFLSAAVIPQLELDTGTSDYNKLFFKTTFDGVTTTIRDLMGSGGFTARDSYSVAQNQTFISRQTQDTEFSGVFLSEDGATDIHKTNLIVEGDGSGNVNTLKLSGANTSNGELKVRDDARVLFSSTGSWANGTVTVADGGYLEVTNSSSVASTLDLQSGGTIKIATYTTTETVGEEEVETLHTHTITAGTVTFPDSGEAAIDISAIPDLGENETATIITASTSLDSDISKLRLVGKPYSLQVNGSSLEVINDGGLVWTSATGWGTKDPTKYSNATITAPGTVVLDGTSLTFDTLTVSGSGALSFSGTGTETINVANLSISDGVILSLSDNLTITSAITGAGALIVDVPSDETMTLPATTATQLTKRGNGELILGGNTFVSGDVSVEAGKLTNSSAATSEFGGIFSVASNASMDVYGQLTLSKNPLTYDSDAIAAFIIQENGNVSVNGRIIVSGVNNRVLIRGRLNIPGDFLCNGDAKVFSCGYVTVTGSGRFWVNYGVVENSGAIALTGLPCLSYNNNLTKITNASTGVVTFNLIANGDVRSTDLTKYIAGSGKVVLNGDSYWFGFSRTGQWSSDIAIENNLGTTKMSGGLVFSRTSAIGTLSGTGRIRADLDTGNTDPSDRVITVVQAANSEWRGILSNAAKMGSIVVTAKKGATAKTLTLSGTQTVGKPLTVTTATDTYDSGSVNLTGTWASDVTVNGEFGGTGTVSGGLTLNAGSTFKAWATGGLTVSGALTLPASGTVTVDVSGLTIGAGDSTTLLTVGSGMPSNVNKFALDSNTHVLSVSGQTLSLVPIAATLTKSDDTVVPFATVQEAVNATANALYTGYKYITVNVNDSTVNAVDMTLKVKYGAGVSGFTVNSPSAEYAADGGVTDSESGITTYSLTPTATTYTWAATGEGAKAWATPANWTYGSGISATRCPQAGDTVIFNDGAAVNHAASVSVAGIVVNGNVTVSGTSSLETSGNVTGSGTLSITGNNSGIASAATGLTVSPNVVFGSGTYIACNSTSGGGPITFNGNVMLPTGTVSLWDAGHTFAGTTTFNGNFTNGGNQTLTLGEVTVAANTTLSGKITFGGAISIGSGITLTTPASNVSFSSASLVGSGTLSLGATLSQALTLTYWSGTVVLPAVNSTPSGGFRLDWYGKSGSTVKIDKGFTAWLNKDVNDAYRVQSNIVLEDSNMYIDGTSPDKWYQIAKLSGSGNFTIKQNEAFGGFHIFNLEDYTGTMANNPTTGVTPTVLTIVKTTLASEPAAGDKLVSASTPDNVTLSAVYVGNTQQEVILEKKTDGIYVAATKSTAMVDEETVTVLDTGSNTTIDATGVSGKVAIPGTVTQISGVEAANLLLKVTYISGTEQTEYYSGILALDGSGNVSLVGNATVNGVSVPVQPAPADSAPLAMVRAGAPTFTIKTIPGLWYKAKVGTAPTNCAFTGTPVQATSATTSIEVSNAFGANDRVKYYKIAVGASSASFQ